MMEYSRVTGALIEQLILYRVAISVDNVAISSSSLSSHTLKSNRWGMETESMCICMTWVICWN